MAAKTQAIFACWCVCLFSRFSLIQAEISNVTASPDIVKDLVEDSVETVFLSGYSTDRNVNIVAVSEDENIAVVYINSSVDFFADSLNSQISTPLDNLFIFNKSIDVKGIFLGKTRLTFYATNSSSGTGQYAILDNYRVLVIREPTSLEHIFTGTVILLVILNTIGFGCILEVKLIKTILKRPIAPLIGFGCQYLINPLIALAMIFAMDLPSELAFGLFAYGCSPGGGGSNVWTILLDGDLNLSLVMTFLSTLLSLGMMPLWLLTVGRLLVDESVSIPFQNIMISLVSLVLPLLVGMCIRRWLPKVAKVVAKCVKVGALIFVVFVLTFGVYANLYMFQIIKQWRVLVSGLVCAWGALIFGGLIAWICRQPWDRIKTIAIETGIQNTGISIVLLKLSLPQPDSDLSAAMPIAAVIFSPIPLFVGFIYLTIKKRCSADKGHAIDLKDDELVKNGMHVLALNDDNQNTL